MKEKSKVLKVLGTVKNLILMIVGFALAAIMLVAAIVGDYFAWAFADNVDRFLGVVKDDFSNANEQLFAGDQLCTEIEEDSIVLFKNDNALPLAATETKVNVFGWNSIGEGMSTTEGFLLRAIGSGSSTISAQKKISLLDAMRGTPRDYDRLNLEDPDQYGEYNDNGEFVVSADMQDQLAEDLEAWAEENLSGYEVNETIVDLYKSGAKTSTGSAEYTLKELNPNLLTESVLSEAYAFSPIALYTLSRTGGENIGEIPDNYLELTAAERGTLEKLGATFDKVIVILNTANTMHLGFLDDTSLGIDACIYVGLTGQSGARAIPEVLSGKINPSGRYTDIVTKSRTVAQTYDPTWANRAAIGGNISYVDDIYYGYKWFETAHEDGYFTAKGTTYDDVVQYPFGYGLSYTSFTQEIVSVTSGNKTFNDGDSFDSVKVGEEITVTVRVTNTGDVAGKDVVQLYYTPQYYPGEIEKAHVNLLDFGKTGLLAAGGSEEVKLTFTPYDMASYDAYDKNNNKFWGYELESGTYGLKVMNDSHTVLDSIELKLDSDVQIEKDPVSDVEVVNRFTGKDNAWSSNEYNGSSYAGLGTDGYEGGGISRSVWFSRSDFAGTFPKGSVKANQSNINNVTKYYNNDYANELPSKDDYWVGEDVELYLVQLAQLDDKGNEIAGTEMKATLAQLEGSNLPDGYQFVYNWDLIEELAADYNEATNPIWTDFLGQMTVSEMKSLIELGGFHRIAIESVGKNREYDYDGPAGYNTNSLTGQWGGDMPDTNSWTAYESEALIGCCWNKTLLFTLGLQQGNEASVTNVNGWYAPGVNLHRSNYSARNYEYYSEDGVLSGKLAAQIIFGAKLNGLNCYLKHYACSEEGPNPGDVNTWITEQNLRENFLRPFEIAVKEGEANSIMTAFNRVGATWAGANYAMNVEVLRNEWGFRGALITDYTPGGGEGGMNTRQGVRGGNDLWLNPAKDSINNGLNETADEVFMRNSAHNLLYTTVDTLNTYRQYTLHPEQLGDEVKEELLEKYHADLGVSFLAKGVSWWKPTAIVIEVVLILGFLVMGSYPFWIKLFKKKGAAEAEGAEAGDAEETPETQETAEAPEEPEEPKQE